jgi:hypothetical protein
MRLLIIHTGDACECFVSSSLFRGLNGEEKYPEVYVIAGDQYCSSIFERNKHVKKVYQVDNLPNEIFKMTFDKLVVLHPDTNESLINSIQSNEKLGFNCSKDSEYFFDILYGSRKSKLNMFQVYFKMAGMIWHGQRYDFDYFPRSKSKDNRTGLAVANSNLRNYIIDKLRLDESRLWMIPYKKNIFRKMDEINKCKRIITDDFFTMNIAVHLKKSIYFLKTIPHMTRIEMFGNGYIYNVPPNIIK